jgi:hypothetical protein
MANSEGMYTKIGVEDDDSQRNNKAPVFKSAIKLIGGTCLVCLTIMAISIFTPALESKDVVESTSLLGLPSSLRSVKKPSPMVPSLNSLPGSSNWKTWAAAGIEAVNGCRGVSMCAHPMQAVLKSMDPASRSVVVNAAKGTITKMEDLKAGQLAPMGFWDPAGLSADLDEGKILFYREAELKHGRVSMLAALGFLVGENFHPLFGGDIDVPSYVSFQATPLQVFWPAVLVALTVLEYPSVGSFKAPVNEDGTYIDKDSFAISADRVPGDIGFDPLGLKPADEEAFLEMQNKELNNGRLAMIAIAGFVAQELVSGEKVLAFDGKLR